MRILEKFGVDKYFDFIGAASFDSSRSSKLAVIQYVLENTGAKPEECLMVGDRMHDIVGAHDAGIKCAAAAGSSRSTARITSVKRWTMF